MAEQSMGTKEMEEVRHGIIAGAKLSAPYLIMNTLATIVACYGLLSDSTAVVIGAMIIAMLLGPIMGLALAMVDGDLQLLRTAIIAETIGALMVVAIGMILGKIHSGIYLTPEILVRTRPNLLDLFIALAGGAAGAYATVSPRVAIGLVGVAISTALVPPLASCGICISRGAYGQAGGAFILFATNLVAIQVASSVVLYAFGYHKVSQRDASDKNYVFRIAADAALFLLLAGFLSVQLSESIRADSTRRKIQETIVNGLRDIPGAYLTEVQNETRDPAELVFAVVRVPNSITPEQTKTIQSALESTFRRPFELHVRSLLTKEVTTAGYLYELPPEERSSLDVSPSTGIDPLLAPTPGP
ncbi:MAG: TIGR00341 family protein [Fimbriimonas sp.]|jgi:uncharacterized hydrophobic protein (TIGR00271 family)|nr:TIGR00341 family protein [Fimbriimonas sp.]